MAIIKDIVERRVNTTGVSEPVVVTQGNDRVVVELPGVTDPDAVRKLVGQTGRLDFVPLGDPRPRRRARSSTSPRRPTAVQRRPGLVGHGRPGPERRPAVDFVLKDDGANLFADYTGKHVGEYFAITLDSIGHLRAASSTSAIPTATSRSRPAASAASRPRRRPTSSRS